MFEDAYATDEDAYTSTEDAIASIKIPYVRAGVAIIFLFERISFPI